ncbi:MAG TPA: efflux RND transporter periplasmic adaptor subunit [bacterium]|nr:efflux RND transporter periplasmic adaptor subunit [bacterium]
MKRVRVSQTGAGIASAVVFVLIVALLRLFYAPAVAVTAVRDGVVTDEVTAPGSVQTRVIVNVSSKLTGILARLYADQGDVVRRGQVLAAVESEDLAAQAAGAQATVGATAQNVTVAEAGILHSHATVAAAAQNVTMAQAGVAKARADVAAATQNVTVAEAGVAKARAALALSQATYNRDMALLREGAIAAADMDAARAARDSDEAGVHSATAAVDAVRQQLAAAQADAHSAAAAVDAAREQLTAAQADAQSAAAVASASRAQLTGAEQNLRYATANLAYARIVAPMDGLIIARNLEAGTTIVPGVPVFLMADPQDVWVAATVDETVVGGVRVGEPARISLRDGSTAIGRVARVTHQADSVTRELEVDVRFTPLPRYFTLNEEANVAIQVAQARGLVVPVSALVPQAEPGQMTAFIARGGKAVPVTVRVGLVAGGRAQVLDGLQAGDLVVLAPQGLRAGSRLRPVISTQAGSTGQGTSNGSGR